MKTIPTVTAAQAMQLLNMTPAEFAADQELNTIQQAAIPAVEALDNEVAELDACQPGEGQRLKMAILLDVVRAVLEGATEEQRHEFAFGVEDLLVELITPAH